MTVPPGLRRLFMAQDADQRRLPVALLSGFLGSGKTTLLNAVLRDPRMAGTAVAINEFGAVPIDNHLVGKEAAGTVTMANGCLCCSVSGDIEDAVLRLHGLRESGEVPRFVRLIVEPSGLADPAPIAQAILRNPALSRVLRLDGIYAVVDALFGGRHLDEHPQVGKAVSLADGIVLTKTDMAAPAASADLRSRLGRLNPAAPVLDVRHGVADPAVLFSTHFLDPDGPEGPAWTRPLRMAEAVAGPAGHGTLATVLTAAAPLDWAGLDGWLRRLRTGLGDRLLRLKGIAAVVGCAQPVVLHGVHHVMHPPVLLDAWPGADRSTRLVLITRDVAGQEVRRGWDELAGALIAP